MKEYSTSDISLATYIEIAANVSCDLKKQDNKVLFCFKIDVAQHVDDFYANKNNFLLFANKLRNMKSRIANVLSMNKKENPML
jgi:hypothetical protein